MKYIGEKPKRRGYVHFEKMRILFRPKWISIALEDKLYKLYYHTPKTLVRSYVTLEAVHNAAKRLQAKFAEPGVELVPIWTAFDCCTLAAPSNDLKE